MYCVMCVWKYECAINGGTESMQAEKNAQIADLQGQIDALSGEVGSLQKEIDILSGWRKGYNGLIGFDWNKSNGWIASPNPDASSTGLSINATAYAMRDKEKYFWHNKGIVQKAWQDIDLSDADSTTDDDGLFDNGTIDILNISSLAGYKLSPKFALSGLGELNTSIEKFLKPGTLDIGIGATWLPIQNMTVVIHPLNYHIAWPAEFDDDTSVSSSSSLGAKVRVDYFRDFNISGKNFNWTTTLTSFIPYSNDEISAIGPDGVPRDNLTLFNYTWINNISFDLWKGIGVGVGFGLRNSDLEAEGHTILYFSRIIIRILIKRYPTK